MVSYVPALQYLSGLGTNFRDGTLRLPLSAASEALNAVKLSHTAGGVAQSSSSVVRRHPCTADDMSWHSGWTAVVMLAWSFTPRREERWVQAVCLQVTVTATKGAAPR
jgi:hypothetical protein